MGACPQMRTFLTTTLFLACPLVAHAAPTLPGIGAAIEKVIAAHEVTGAVTLVATKDAILHLEATGLSDVGNKRQMTPDTLFFLASTTKPITAAAVLMLQDEGKLKLSDPVAKYIPESSALTRPSGKRANLTIAQLLTHTSGIAEIGRDEYRAKDLASLVSKCVVSSMRFEPDQEWRYTTSGYEVAARIVEIVSGKSYDEFLEERLFKPLGMTSTTFYPPPAQRGRQPLVYIKNPNSGALDPTPAPELAKGRNAPLGGAGLFSTASDLGRLCQMLLNRGTFEGKRYLSEEAYRLTTTVQTGDLPTGFSKAQINDVLGWGTGCYVVRNQRPGVSALLSRGSFGHPGALGTHIIVDPVKGRAYVFLVQRPNLSDNFENEPLRTFLQAAISAIEQPST